MILSLLRAKQWYKNLVIFLPLIFVGLALNSESILLTILGFFALCLMSSTNYIINDIIDIEKDKIHPEKKNRPIPSGLISISTATIIAMLLATSSLVISFLLSTYFFYTVLTFFILTQLYSVFFKDEIFLDIILISINFVLRAISGAFILSVIISPWLILCTFFLALFLASGKRKADLSLLKDEAINHKKVLGDYSSELTNTLILVSTILLIVSYSLYSFLSIYPQLIYTLPIAIYVIFRYFYLIQNDSIIARHPENFYKDSRLLLGIKVWVLVIILLIYFWMG
ncbi:MAG: UbiA family prenyltransferase [Nanoarchaeota archaeon]|nr:UbiA family prenyltransferase [Nanoarchaeota archaeon]